jgi:hypothetical protein
MGFKESDIVHGEVHCGAVTRSSRTMAFPNSAYQ